jgi:hypothetical protein
VQDRIFRRAPGLPLPLGVHLLDDRVLTSPAPRVAEIAPAEVSARGSTRYALGVSGLVVAVETRRPGARLECSGRSRAFLVADVPVDLRLEVDWCELRAKPDGRALFDSGGVWRAFEIDGGLVLRFHDASVGRFPYKEARLGADGRHGVVRLDPRACPPGRPVDPLEYPLDELLIQRLLAARGGLELHAAGVVEPSSGRGYLFAGQSGDGKTTTARLWQETVGAAVLSDDRIVLTREADGWRMHGTPWHGEAELALPASAPLAGIFVLGRGGRNTLASLSPARAVAALVARSFPPFHDAPATVRLVQRLEALVGEVPCRLFPFVPGGEAVRFILRAVA